jgi:carbon monoxide dehydrogenase subunit G
MARARHRTFIGLGCLVVAAGWLVPVPSLASLGGAEFSKRERLRLQKGELVVRRTEEQRGALHLVGGTSWQVVNLPLERVRPMVSDVSRYGKMLPGVSSFRQVQASGSHRTVRICHKKSGVQGCYHANVRFANGGRDVFFQLDPARSNDLRAGWGFVRIAPWGEGKTLLCWGVMADVGHGIMAGLVRPAVLDWMLKVPTTMKEYIERKSRA